MTRGIVVACLLCALTLLCGCLEGPTGPKGEKGDNVLVKEEPSIIGVWNLRTEPVNADDHLVIRSDGSYYSHNMETGTYKIEGNAIIFTRLRGKRVYTYEFILANNFLSLKSMDDDGIYTDYIRISESIRG